MVWWLAIPVGGLAVAAVAKALSDDDTSYDEEAEERLKREHLKRKIANKKTVLKQDFMVGMEAFFEAQDDLVLSGKVTSDSPYDSSESSPDSLASSFAAVAASLGAFLVEGVAGEITHEKIKAFAERFKTLQDSDDPGRLLDTVRMIMPEAAFGSAFEQRQQSLKSLTAEVSEWQDLKNALKRGGKG